jgi:predicted dehydrogenase
MTAAVRPKLRVAVVGLGIGRSHLLAYRNLADRYDIAGVCDLDETRLKVVADELRLDASALRTTRFEALLDPARIDVVDLCTPPYTHRAMIEQVLAAGQHVICEKPLVGSLADMDAVTVAASAAGRFVFPIFQYRFGNGLQKLKHLQAKGFARVAYLTTIETAWLRGAKYYAVPWRGKWKTELGGCCLTHALHSHDILSYVNGPAATVSARLATRVNDIEVEDCAAISIGMRDGSVATLAVTLGAAEEISRLSYMFADLTAESRSPDQYRPGKESWHIKGRTPELDTAIAAALEDYAPQPEGFEGEFAGIHATLVDGCLPPVSLDDARQSLELITAIYESAENDTVVALPIARDHPKYGGWVPASGGFARLQEGTRDG